MSDRFDETWHRLRAWTKGQTPSERLSAQILLHEGYKDLDPIHPLGGKDGKKDALCTKDGKKWVMAVYFPRGEKEFRAIKDKFADDIEGVKENEADALAFVTNQELKLSERSKLEEIANGIPVELFHLERITAILDKPVMRDVRRQFLQINYGEEEKIDSARRLLKLSIQQDRNLLLQLLEHDDQSYLSEKWQSCFEENHTMWRDSQSKILLAQSISDELMTGIQSFYNDLNDIEERCRKLLELKAMIAPLRKKLRPGGGVLAFGTMHTPAWAEKYVTTQDDTALLGAKKINAIKLRSLKELVQLVFERGNELIAQLEASVTQNEVADDRTV